VEPKQHQVTADELKPDGEILLSLTLDGRPTTKKTSQNVVMIKGRPRVLSSKRYIEFEKKAKVPFESAWIGKGKEPMDFGVAITMRVWLDSWVVGDHTGYMQALGDILEKWGIIANDSWIAWENGSEHWFGGVDKDNPRTEITIRRKRHPKELFREEKERKLKAA